MEESEDVVQVQEQVIPRRQPWIWFDWRNFLVIAAMSAFGLLARYLQAKG